MIHLKQKSYRSRCMIHCLAMLSNRTPRSLLRRYTELTGRNYDSAVEKLPVFTWRQGVELLAKELGIAITWPRPVLMRIWAAEAGASELDLSGEGILSLIWKSGGAHAIAFSDSIIHDPDEAAPRPFVEWFADNEPLIYSIEVISRKEERK